MPLLGHRPSVPVPQHIASHRIVAIIIQASAAEELRAGTLHATTVARCRV